MSRASSSTVTIVSLLAATLGFAGGWHAHRQAARRMLQPYRGPVKPVVPPSVTCASELALVESECPGAARFIVPERSNYYRIERQTLKCLMASTKTPMLQMAPNYTAVSFQQKPAGFRIFDVKPCSLAARAGLLNGDVIRSVDSRPVNTEEDLVAAYGRLGTGNFTSVVLQRQGKLASLVYFLGAPR